MPSITGQAELLKVDRRGRVHVPAERREALLDEFERSGASAPEFARLVGIKYGTFAGWRARRGRAANEQRSAAPAGPRLAMAAPPPAVPFFETVIATSSPPPASPLVVELPGGGRLLVGAAGQIPWVAELLRLLGTAGGRPC